MAGNDDYTKLLIHSNTTDGSTTFVDSSVGGSTHTITPDALTKHSTDQQKFGTSSIFGDINNDFAGVLTLDASADYDFGSGDFTVDFWFFPTTSTYIELYGGTYSLAIVYNSGGVRNICIGAYGTTVSHTGNGVGSISLTLNAWNHIAITRDGDNWRTFINGVKDVDIVVSGTISEAGIYTPLIGKITGWARATFDGYIDEFRISKGIARWTANFTPPVSEYIEPSELIATIPLIEPVLLGGGFLAPSIPVIEPFLGGGGLLAPTFPLIIPLTEGSDDINHGNIHLTFPSVSASITEGITGALAVTVPMITATINESIDRGNVSVILPIITAEMIGGIGGFLEVSIPLITADIVSGALCEVSIPVVTSTLTGVVGEIANLNQILPVITSEITGKVETLGDIDTILPMLQVYMAGLTGKLISGNITLPMITVDMQGYPDFTGDIDAVLSLISVYMVGTVERTTCDVLRYIEPEL